MANTKLGKVSITPAGEFALGTAYQRLDLVYSEYAAYLSKEENVDVPLDDPNVWMKIVEGIPGKSAYQTAVEAGYQGSEEDFLNDLTNFQEYADRAEIAEQNASQFATNASASAEQAALSQEAAKSFENSAKLEADRAKSEADRASGAAELEVTIPVSGWEEDTDTNGAFTIQLDIEVPNITDSMIPILTILPESQSHAQSCGMSTACRTLENTLRVYAKEAPEIEMLASLALLNPGNGEPGS